MLRRRRAALNDDGGGLPSEVALLPMMVRARSMRGGLPVLNIGVGRDELNELRLTSQLTPLLLSRFHAILSYVDGTYFVCDLGSMNGTYVNGRVIAANVDWKLEHRDTLSFGGPANVVMRNGLAVKNPFSFYVEAPRRSKRLLGQLAGDAPTVAPQDAFRIISATLAGVLDRGAARVAAARAAAGPSHGNTACAPRGAAQPLGNLPPEMVKRAEAEGTCSICLHVMVAPHAITCGHAFCGQCLLMWLEKNGTCPLCRRESKAEAVPVRMLDLQIRDILEPRLSDEERRHLQTRHAAWEDFCLGRDVAKRARVERAVGHTNAELRAELRRLRGALPNDGEAAGGGFHPSSS